MKNGSQTNKKSLILMTIAFICKMIWMSLCLWAAWNMVVVELVPVVEKSSFGQMLLLGLFVVAAKNVNFIFNDNKSKD